MSVESVTKPRYFNISDLFLCKGWEHLEWKIILYVRLFIGLSINGMLRLSLLTVFFLIDVCFYVIVDLLLL